MSSVREHYENHLADYYAWIFGGLRLKIEENRQFFARHNIRPLHSGLAFDLGAGCGFQSIPLAELGFRVVALDLSSKLLTQLEANAAGLAIETICGDLLNFAGYDRGAIELLVCMGDTLTHLESLDSVQKLLSRTHAALESGGRLVLTFRNLARALSELDRFIPVRSDAHRIFTCFLEYEKDFVKVNDIIYEKRGSQWAMKKSFFRKLRLYPKRIRNYLQQIGFTIESYEEQSGMVSIIARKA
jgi:2-polyprenyl-3-methyl-5-hydroxy-6-metoxy-1,4-benzoquinol methylase